MTPAEEVDVEMGDGFAAVGAVVDGDAEAGFRDSEFGGELSGGEQKVAEKRLVFSAGFADPWDIFFRDDEDVLGCLWRGVTESAAEIVLV